MDLCTLLQGKSDSFQFLGDVVHLMFVMLPRSLRFLPTFITSSLPEHFNIDIASGRVSPNIPVQGYTASKDSRTFRVSLELRRSLRGLQSLEETQKTSVFLTSFLQSGPFFVPSGNLLLLSFLRLSGPVFRPNRGKSFCLLDFCGSTTHPCVSFWDLDPQYLDTSCSNPESKTSLVVLTIVLVVPTIVQRVLERVVDACSRLPHDIDVFQWNGEDGFILDVQLRPMYFELTKCEATTHAPSIFTILLFENGAQGFVWRAIRRHLKVWEIRLHMETTFFLCVRLPDARTV